MSLGIKAMAANYAGLQVTSHNIANANVAGYSRQQAELATSQGQFTGAGFFGRGVDVVSVTRAHNDYLTREAASAKSLAGMDSARLQQLQQLENIFKPGEMGLGSATSDLMNALTDLTSQPADLATRQVVLARAADLASRFSEAGALSDACVREFVIASPVEEGHEARVRISVVEVFPYTSTLAITQVNSVSDWIDPPGILVRMYHDASTAEAVAYQGHRGFLARYALPNPTMYHQDEKRQINEFLGEWLSLCLQAGRSLNAPEFFCAA